MRVLMPYDSLLPNLLPEYTILTRIVTDMLQNVKPMLTRVFSYGGLGLSTLQLFQIINIEAQYYVRH